MPRLQLPIDALMQDAGEYARTFDVTLDEAMHRLRAQSESIAVTDRLRETYRDRWAGIAVDHRPTYRIVILLTGTEPVPDQSIVAGGIVIPIVFRTGAAMNRTGMLAIISTYQARIRDALPHPPGLGIDPRTGALLVMISGRDAELDRDGALRARIEAMTGVPVRIEAVDSPAIDSRGIDSTAIASGAGNPAGVPPIQTAPVETGRDPLAPIPNMVAVSPPPPITGLSSVEGGARVVGVVGGKRYACTTGFVVTDGSRFGIATAAHCPDVLTYVDTRQGGIPLDFIGQWGWGYQDVQVNTVAAGPPLAPSFYANTAKTRTRTVSTWRNRESTRAGDFVCHRGERTGYSCAQVAIVDFAPAGDLCGGACLPTWVAVEGPTCKAGDSGAPVFDGTIALGLVKGGTYRRDGECLFYYYMSTDYLPTGWSLAYRLAIPRLPPAPPPSRDGAALVEDGTMTALPDRRVARYVDQ
ncbi:hypothetical protein U1737_15840 [Sphingomonas sp. LB3N6]|uniref:hypothetical protein n=1 Tax=Sphingomonas fucosidasi TaxID=3096164 RepID=UPI002FCC0585